MVFIYLSYVIDITNYIKEINYNFKTVSQFIKHVQNVNQGLNNRHVFYIKGLQIEWDVKYPFISGVCNSCCKYVNGFEICKGTCWNKKCNNKLSIETITNKWISARFKCCDINNDSFKFEAISSHTFGINAIKKCTKSQISSITTYLQLKKDNFKLWKILRNRRSIVMNAKIIVTFKKLRDLKSHKIKIQIDVF